MIEIAPGQGESTATQQLAGAYGDTLARFEHGLGDPAAAGPLSFEAAADRDRREAYPQDAIDRLAALGAHHLQVPAAEGGQLHSLEQLIAGSYSVGRRDPSAALSGGLQMWSQLVWMAGSPVQRAAMRALLEENAAIALAASERDHGADLLSTACHATTYRGGYFLDGEKWPIGSATSCRATLVLARTRRERGARSLSWFFVGPDALGQDGCRRLPKVHTVGMRASDVGGFHFDAVALDHDSLIGWEGAGVELAIKLFQLTRPLVASLALGPGDTALRIAGEFAAGRELYGRSAADLPGVRRALVRGWVDLLVAEAVAATTARGAHVDPRGLASASLVAKIAVPSLVQSSVEQASRVLGSRALMRDHARGMFDRVERDQRVASVLDGSTEVCLQSLATHLPAVLRGSGSSDVGAVVLICTVRRPVPPLAYPELDVAPRAPSTILSALDTLVARADAIPGSLRAAADAVAERVAGDRVRLEQRVGRIVRECAEVPRALELADAASDYASLHALATCVPFAVCNAGCGSVVERPSWLWMAARRLSGSPLAGAPPEHELVDDLYHEFSRRIARGELLSAFHSTGALHG